MEEFQPYQCHINSGIPHLGDALGVLANTQGFDPDAQGYPCVSGVGGQPRTASPEVWDLWAAAQKRPVVRLMYSIHTIG